MSTFTYLEKKFKNQCYILYIEPKSLIILTFSSFQLANISRFTLYSDRDYCAVLDGLPFDSSEESAMALHHLVTPVHWPPYPTGPQSS